MEPIVFMKAEEQTGIFIPISKATFEFCPECYYFFRESLAFRPTQPGDVEIHIIEDLDDGT